MKQVIVIRKDLNMRKGKMVAQGAHASLSAFLATNTSAREQWLLNGQTKICVGVNSLEELEQIYNKGKAAGLPCALILDAAHTEFKEPTYTAVAIGPCYEGHVDTITGELKLL